MRKEYTKPELNISEYIIDETITASSNLTNNFGGGFADTDTQVSWEDFIG